MMLRTGSNRAARSALHAPWDWHEKRIQRDSERVLPMDLGMQQSFTLIEIIVTIVILSVGIVLIFETLFKSLDAFEYSSHRLWLKSLVNEELWRQEDILRHQGVPRFQDVGVFTIEGKEFPWRFSAQLAYNSQELYEFKISVFEASKKRIDSFSQYVRYIPDEDQE